MHTAYYTLTLSKVVFDMKKNPPMQRKGSTTI